MDEDRNVNYLRTNKRILQSKKARSVSIEYQNVQVGQLRTCPAPIMSAV